MTIIVEDGSIVENANSYMSVAEIKTFAEDRGYTLPATDPEIEKLVIRSMDYLESLSDKYLGSKTEVEQELQWPRTSVFIDGFEVHANFIPPALKRALAQAVVDSQSGELMSAPTPAVKKQKVDVIETEFFEDRKSVV